MTQAFPELVPVGIAGLDEVLNGGLPQHHIYLVQGTAGSGKTTIGIQFLMEGARRGEKALLITLAEAKEDLYSIALAHGWSLDGIEIFELTAAEAAQQLHVQQTIFPTAEIELSELTDKLTEVLREKRPQRVLFDSITEIRLLADDPRRYRQQVLMIGKVLDEIEATVIFTERLPLPSSERVLDSVVHGIIRLERRVPEYGAARRRLEISKLRGMHYREGWHDFRIATGGVELFPRLPQESIIGDTRWPRLTSGIDEIDAIIGGGFEYGSALLMTGTSGTGKSSVANQLVYSALQQGVAAAILLSDERPQTLFKRSDDLGISLRPFHQSGLLTVRQIETGTITPGEFAHYVRELVHNGVKLIVIDSLTGYLRAMPEETLVLNQMHDLLNYLSHRGVLSISVVTRHGLLEEGVAPALDMSYLADTVMLFRHFEAAGTLRQVISVIKKRHSDHEKTLRELHIRTGGIMIGPPLTEFRGVLTGYPDYHGGQQALLDD